MITPACQTTTARAARSSLLALASLALLVATFAAGCRQEMADQPSLRPLRPTKFFADGRSARPLLPGVVPRGVTVYSEYAAIGPRPLKVEGDVPGSKVASGSVPASTGAGSIASPAPAGGPRAELVSLEQIRAAGYTDKIPFAVSADDMSRGQQRFNIYCAVCHDATGSGKGAIVERGFTKPPSFHTDRLRQAPLGYFYHVIKHGYGSMPDYATQIPARDRWLIAAYVRALQVSQNTTLSALPAAEAAAARTELDKPAPQPEPNAHQADEKSEKHK